MPRKPLRPHAPELTPTLRARFDALLWTYFLKGATPYPPEQKSGSWEQEYEERYGDGHFAYRKTLLQSALTTLESRGRVDLGQLCEVLERARYEALSAVIHNTGLQGAREIVTRRTKVRTDLQRSLLAAIRFHESDMVHPLTEVIRLVKSQTTDPAPTNPSSATYRTFLDEVVTKDPLLHPSPSGLDLPDGPYRHKKAGHRPEPWLTTARQALRQLRVPVNMREELLIAIGLKRMGPSAP